MAIWQYNFLVIPKSTFSNGNLLKDYLDEDGFLDDESCWLVEPIKVDFFNELRQILARNESWSSDITLFGEQDSNRFEVYTNEDGNVVSVSFCIDYTSDYEVVLRSVIDFISMNGFVILDEKQRLVDNNYIVIESLIENSDQRIIYDKLKGNN